MINKDTAIFGSFSNNPGNLGCTRFNKWFQESAINAIYKSFKINDLLTGCLGARELGFRGFALGAPFKIQMLSFLDVKSPEVSEIGSCNTVTIDPQGKFTGYNTDWLAIQFYLIKYYPNLPSLIILGDGGYSKACQFACKISGRSFKVINRASWDTVPRLINSVIFNCTPIKNLDTVLHKSNVLIDCDPQTPSGEELSLLQARQQFKLYKESLVKNV
jgi:shikimate 5-dehydrogenase